MGSWNNMNIGNNHFIPFLYSDLIYSDQKPTSEIFQNGKKL